MSQISLAWLTPDLISIYIEMRSLGPHIHFLVFEAWFTIARSRLLGAANVLSYESVLIANRINYTR